MERETGGGPDPARWGVDLGYEDVDRVWQDAPHETVSAVLGHLHATLGSPPPSPVRVVKAGSTVDVGGPWELITEDRDRVMFTGAIPADLAPGYHRLLGDAGELTLIVTPGRCHLPPGLRKWGFAVQLYAMRSRDSGGIGDLADLARFTRWSADHGAGLTLVNPLHASLPTVQQPSPYFPSSRCFRNPIYLRVVGGAGAGLNTLPTIDRERVWAAKRPALEAEFASFGGDPGFDTFCREGGDLLRSYATFCVISEAHGVPWSAWPAGLRRPDGPEVAAVAVGQAERVRFHMWLQWRIEEQLAEAGRPLDLMQDLAIGCDPAGADTWLWQDAFALGCRVGAPPDEFNRAGQDWGLPPFDPWKLRSAAYEPFIKIARAGFRHAGGLRIDHVMGLFRLFWIPEGGSPKDGTYVRYPWEDLLGILALESQRAGAYVVGEDLGTVEDGVRERLEAAGVLSYRLVWFEDEAPSALPAQALAAVTTHDLPTIAGLVSGEDEAELRVLGLAVNDEGTDDLARRLRSAADQATATVPGAGADADADADDLAVAVHRALAASPAMLVTATIEDALGVRRRPNVPGTTDERPNWSLPLPVSLEEIEGDARVALVVAALQERKPAPIDGSEASPTAGSEPGRRQVGDRPGSAD